MFRFRLTSRDCAFYDAFDECASVIVETAEAFGELIRDYRRRDVHVGRIHELEHAGDAATKRILDRLDQTFITPIDREDILQLARGMDDIVDEIDAAAKRMTLYEIPEPTPAILAQVGTLIAAAEQVALAVSGLRNLHRATALPSLLIEIHRLEKVADEIHHSAVAELFRRSPDAITVIKWREIYGFTERAIDRCDDVGNTIRSIVLKNG